MLTSTRLALSAAFLALLAGPAAARSIVETPWEFRFTGAIGSGRAIEVKGVLGDVVAEPASGNEVEVVAEKKAGAGDASKVRFEVRDHEGGTTVSVVYPESMDPDVRVNFRVRVPAGVRFVGRTANGRVETARLNSPVEAQTVNGDIDIQTTKEARATTVNGSITARLDTMAAAGRLETVNGNVTVSLSPGVGTDLDARTTNGAVTSSMPVSRAQEDASRFSGAMGRGGSRLDLRTVNGDIFLRSLHR